MAHDPLDDLTRKLKTGNLSRHEFLKQGVIAGVSLPVLGALLGRYGSAAVEAAVSRSPEMTQLGSGKPLVGFILRSKGAEPRWVHDDAGFIAEAKKLRASVVTAFPTQESQSEQFTMAQSMISQGIKVLCIVSVDPTAATSLVQYAKSHGVKVVAYDAPIPNTGIAAVVMRSNVQMGNIIGRLAVHNRPKGNYVLVNGDETTPVALQKLQGIKQAMRPYLRSGHIKIVSEQFNKNWLPSSAQTQVETAIARTGGNIAAVVSSNDGMAEGAFTALKAHGIARRVYLTGEDNDLVRIQTLAAGYPGMSGWTPILREAATAAQVSIRLARGNPLHPDEYYNNGGADRRVPAYLVPVSATTRRNIHKQLIAIGYYSCDQVYGGLPKKLWATQCR